VRLAPLVCSLLLAAGCIGPGARAERAVKELYVEVLDDAREVGLVRFPLSAEDEASCYVTMRRLQVGQHDDVSGLVALLEDYAGLADADPRPADQAAEQAEPRAEPALAPQEEATTAEGASRKDAPAMLLTRLQPEAVTASSCYLGQASFLRADGSPIPAVVHHLRLLIVNREGGPLRIAAGGLVAEGVDELPGADEEADAVDAAAFELLGELAPHGRVRGHLAIRPGEHALLEAFFVTDRVFPFLRVRWSLEAVAPGEDPGASEAAFRWQFEARLRRRYVITDGALDPAEAQVAAGRPVPAARARAVARGTHREGRLSPMPLGSR